MLCLGVMHQARDCSKQDRLALFTTIIKIIINGVFLHETQEKYIQEFRMKMLLQPEVCIRNQSVAYFTALLLGEDNGYLCPVNSQRVYHASKERQWG